VTTIFGADLRGIGAGPGRRWPGSPEPAVPPSIAVVGRVRADPCGWCPGRPDQAAVCRELFWADVRRVARREPEELRLRPRWRVDVSKGRWVEAGLSWRAHQSVLL
jgi:hypothetical protein